MADDVTLMLDGKRFARARIARVNLQAGVRVYSLTFLLEVSYPGSPAQVDVQEFRLAGEVRVGPSHNMANVYLGQLELVGSRWVIPPDRDAETTQTLTVDLSPERLAAMDAIRLPAQGLFFRIDLYPLLVTREGPVALSFVQLQLEVPESVWLAQLESSGFVKTLLMEIPLENPRWSRQFTRAIQRLTEARDAYLNLQYRDSVGKCRDVLEALSGALKDKRLVDSAGFDNLRAKDKTERLRILRHALAGLTHPARHPDTGPEVEYSAADAVAVLGMTASLLRSFVEPPY